MSTGSDTAFFASRPKLQRLLDALHATSLEQEGRAVTGYSAGRSYPLDPADQEERATFADKLVALDQDKAQAMYMILRAANAQRVMEAGTSYGISLLYLVAAVRDNVASRATPSGGVSGLGPQVWGTELEQNKVEKAWHHLRIAFEDGGEAANIIDSGQVKILQGDILQTIPAEGIAKGSLDALLLDIWAPLALPVVQALGTAFRSGSLLFIDNCTSGRERYSDLLAYLADGANGWQWVTLPFAQGFGLAVKH
ncbi:unnamed protein product [Parajaminaea phylloscopi]